MKPFIPESHGQKYYYIEANGSVSYSIFQNFYWDYYRIQTGNCYLTLEAAEYHRRMEIKSWQIRQFAFEPDWSDHEQKKFCSFFDKLYNKINFRQECWTISAKTYFPSEETAQAAFADVSNDDFLYMQSRGMI